MQVFFRRYQVSRILRAANAYKLRGVPVLSIFLLVFRMVFQQRSVYTLCCCLLNDSKRSLCWMKGRSKGSCKAS